MPARGKALVKTDLQVAIPAGTYARVAPRSGLAWKHFIDVGAGVVDFDYRGPVGVILFNHSDLDFAGVGRERDALARSRASDARGVASCVSLASSEARGPRGAAHLGEDHDAAGG